MRAESYKLLYSGKSKSIYLAEEGKAIMVFKDDVTAFNKKYHDIVPGKGELAAKLSARMFEILESAGVKTHYICYMGGSRLLVRLASVIPLEVIVRNYAYGSMLKRMPLIEKMKELNPPVVEFHYKSDELGDPLVTEADIIAAGLLDAREVEEVKRLALRVNDVLTGFWGDRGFRLVDFKIEVARGDNGFIVVDEITGDTMRLVDSSGRHYDKEVYRSTRNTSLLLEAYRELVRIAGEPVRVCERG
jgi:phosphoribosylaminoimidazole-succinocarboxamide synthase